MKFYNPYIDKKIRVKKELNIKFTKNLFKILERRNYIQKKLGVKMNYTNKLNSWYEFMNTKRDYTPNRLYENSSLDITDIYIEDLITIDNIDKAKDGLNRFLNKFSRNLYFSRGDKNLLEDFVSSTKNNYKLGRWSNIGSVKFPDEHKLSKFINYISLNLEAFTSSLVRINIHISVTDYYNEGLKNILDDEYNEVNLLYRSKSYSKKLIKGVNIKGENGEAYRCEDYQNMLIHLKYSVLEELGKYVDLYFHSRKIVPPSIEIFNGKKVVGDQTTKTVEYLRGMGINKRIEFDYNNSKDPKWEIYTEAFRTDFDSNSLKCIVDIDKIEVENIDNGLFSSEKAYMARDIFTPLLIDTISKDTYNTLGGYKVQISKNIRGKLKYKKLFAIRYDIEKSRGILNNIKDEVDFRILDKEKIDLEKYFGFKYEKNIINIIFNNSKNKLSESIKDIDSNRELIDSNINLLSIESNRKAQNTTILLTIITVVLAFLTLILTWISVKNMNT